MRLWSRYIVVLVPTLALTVYFGSRGSGLGTLLMFVTPFAATLISLRYLSCPHCGRYALMRPNAWSAPWPGTHCRHCGSEY